MPEAACGDYGFGGEFEGTEVAAGQGAADVEEADRRRVTKEYMDDLLEGMRQEFAKQLEVQMAAVMKEVQDQKVAPE